MRRLIRPIGGAVSIVAMAAWTAAHARRQPALETIPLTPGLIIDRSVVIRPGRYELPAPADLRTPAIRVRGEGITVDFNGATLAGGPDDADPDGYAGVGVLIEGGRHVTLKNASIRGYKVGILARQSEALRLTGNDLSYNWKQRLHSGIEKESLVDWMSYHDNEREQWLRYGAAIYLIDCHRAEIDRTTVVQGQNGLMATTSTGLKIWNNTFQFLSSIGIGLYRVTASTIMHNRIDWCVRGYSHGFYNRGQDSAGLLMYEQTHRNRVAFNSVTHGGDGLFLWAGASTMDTGQGGSNDNYFFGNDFSHAPANGIEATFSRNRFVRNRVEENWHGVWGGYSYESEWLENRFSRNGEAIAIEHGQTNTIVGNTFDGDEVAIRLWQNATQDPTWGYPKHRDTRSRDYYIAGNSFRDHKTALQITDTADVEVRWSRIERVGIFAALAGATPGFSLDARTTAVSLRGDDLAMVAPLPDGIDPMIKDGERRGRRFIIVDEWGPYDWKSPKLWPAGKPDENPLRLRVLGPDGAWKVAEVRGASVEPMQGRVPGAITVTPASSAPVDFAVGLEYRGTVVTSPRGARTPAGSPYRFEYRRFFVPVPWTVQFFEYGEATDPVKQPARFAELVAGAPLKTLTTDRLDFISGRAVEEGIPRDRFALVAQGVADLPPGDYTLRVISDDGVRVWVDGALVVDAWTPHESRVDEAAIAGGRRALRVEYYEAAGFAELRVDIQPGRTGAAR
jgi:nitrous oxidase accessory protein NosD